MSPAGRAVSLCTYLPIYVRLSSDRIVGVIARAARGRAPLTCRLVRVIRVLCSEGEIRLFALHASRTPPPPPSPLLLRAPAYLSPRKPALQCALLARVLTRCAPLHAADRPHRKMPKIRTRKQKIGPVCCSYTKYINKPTSLSGGKPAVKVSLELLKPNCKDFVPVLITQEV